MTSLCFACGTAIRQPQLLAASDRLVVEHEVLVGGLPDALAHRAQVQVGVEHLVVAEQLHALLRQRPRVVARMLLIPVPVAAAAGRAAGGGRACLAAVADDLLVDVLYHLSDLEEVVGDEALPLERLVAEVLVRQDVKCDLK